MRKMLFVALNQYPQRSNWLNGCVNDADDMMSEINAVYGRLGKDILYKTLLNSQATTSAIKEGLMWLVKDLQAGDIAAFFYSGHGSFMPTNDSTEPDGKSECLCPYDMNWRDKMVTDKDLTKIFSNIDKDAMLLCMIDACHSADVLRGMSIDDVESKDLSKFLAPPEKIEGATYPIMREIRVGGRYENQRAILLSGCASNQTSADAFINGRYNGAFTYFVLKTLKVAPGISYKDLINQVSKELKAAGYEQIPELNCSEEAADWSFLGGPIAV